jgi:hypothetical protein
VKRILETIQLDGFETDDYNDEVRKKEIKK